MKDADDADVDFRRNRENTFSPSKSSVSNDASPASMAPRRTLLSKNGANERSEPLTAKSLKPN